MDKQTLINLLGRGGLKVGMGMILGMWIAVQYPAVAREIFISPTAQALMSLAITMFGFYQSWKNEQGKVPNDPKNNV